VELVAHQDYVVCERLQRGVRSRAFTHGVLAEKDELLNNVYERYRAQRGPLPTDQMRGSGLSGSRSWLKRATPVAPLTESNPDSASVNGPAQDRDVSLPDGDARPHGFVVARCRPVMFVSAWRRESLRMAPGSLRRGEARCTIACHAPETAMHRRL
jgi:hypothetical protein